MSLSDLLAEHGLTMVPLDLPDLGFLGEEKQGLAGPVFDSITHSRAKSGLKIHKA